MALLQIAEPGESAAPHQHKLAVGIDLGTTNSLVATVRSSSAEAIAGMGEPYAAMVANYMGATGNVFAKYGQSGDDIAQIIADLAGQDKPPFRTITSDFAKAMVKPKVVDETGNNVVDLFAARLSPQA